MNISSIISSFTKLVDLFSKGLQKISQWRNKRLTVDLIEDFGHEDLEQALRLYTGSPIPADERFETTDIIRWLRQSQQAAKIGTSISRDYFLTAKCGSRVCGFILFHYYHKERIAFFAYFVIAKDRELPDGRNLAARNLMVEAKRLFKKRKGLKDCEGFVLEVDDPRSTKSKKVARERLARIRRFCMLAEAQGLTLRAFDMNYKQPRLCHVEDGSIEKTMLLMYAPYGSQLSKSSVPVSLVKRILKFTYLTVYPDGYSEIEDENKVYHSYLKKFYEQQIEALPHPVQTLDYKQLEAKIKVKFAGTGESD